jgi:cytoskeleton protein RodZ
MSENSVPEGTAEREKSGQSDGLTAGMMIRKAREAAGLHVAALAVSMKIPVKKLEALEADRLDLLHDAVFVRALAASVSRALKIDPAPVLFKLPLTVTPKLNADERGINAPFHATGGAARLTIAEILGKPSAMFALALLVAGVAVVFFPEGKLTEWTAELSAPSVKASTAKGQAQVPQAATEVVESMVQPESVAPVVPTMPSATIFPKEAMGLAPNTAVATPTSPAAKVSEVPAQSQDTVRATGASPLLPSTELVVFKAKESSWVKVVDAKGVVLLSKTLSSGEVIGASGATPLAVVVGRVDATDVDVRGKPFSLTSVSKDNVARFEVK